MPLPKRILTYCGINGLVVGPLRDIGLLLVTHLMTFNDINRLSWLKMSFYFFICRKFTVFLLPQQFKIKMVGMNLLKAINGTTIGHCSAIIR